MLLARAWLRLDQAQSAAEALASVIAVDADNPEANRLAGEALFRLKRHPEALVALKKSYRTAPDSATAGLIGRCHFALGDTARAKEMLEIAVAEDVCDPALSLILARIHLTRGGGALAEQHLLLALEHLGCHDDTAYGLLMLLRGAMADRDQSYALAGIVQVR